MKKIFFVIIFTLFFSYYDIASAQLQQLDIDVSSFAYTASYNNNCNLVVQASFSFEPETLLLNKTYKVTVSLANEGGGIVSGSSAEDKDVIIPTEGSMFTDVFVFQNISNANNLNYVFSLMEYNVVGQGDSQSTQFSSQQNFPITVQDPCNVSSSTSTSFLQSESLSIDIPNPIPSVNSISSFIGSAMEIVMKIGIPLLVLMVVYSGALYLFARGNPNKIKEAHDALTYTLIGGVILLASWGIMQMIYSALISVTAFEYSMLLFV